MTDSAIEEVSTQTVNTEYVASVATRRRIVITSLLFTWSLIVAIVWEGDPKNSLHTSALAWAFVTNVAVLFAYSFGVIVQKYFTK